jgi:two-component system OmpR family response regulator/two-component system copper resistance phosphate regulon response regulator CusR
MDVLVIEDEAILGKALQRGLSDCHHDCTWVRSGRKGLDLILSQRFDAIILDLLLPDLDGIEILNSLRAEGVQTPVLVLTALGSVENRVRGLRCGADDYLVKPFAFPELTARLEALCRRSGRRPSMTHTVGPLSLDITTRRASRGGREIDLSPTEFTVLEYLMRFAGHVVTRKMLSEHVWDDDWDGTTNVIDVHINRLRNKIDRGFDIPLIHTVRGHGYVLRAAETNAPS